MGTKDRRTRVLKAIVRDYVSAREPVGSRSLVERYGISSTPSTRSNPSPPPSAGPSNGCCRAPSTSTT